MATPPHSSLRWAAAYLISLQRTAAERVGAAALVTAHHAARVEVITCRGITFAEGC